MKWRYWNTFISSDHCDVGIANCGNIAVNCIFQFKIHTIGTMTWNNEYLKLEQVLTYRKSLTITEKYLLYSITKAGRTWTIEHKIKVIIHIFLYLSSIINTVLLHVTKSIKKLKINKKQVYFWKWATQINDLEKRKSIFKKLFY